MPMPSRGKNVIDLSELYTPHEKQKIAHTAGEQNILYGG